MKLKFVLVALIVLGFATVGCSNDSDKNEIKKEKISEDKTTKKELKWFSPTDKELTWEKADEGCRDNGGMLATIVELNEVIIDCGGRVTRDLGKVADKNMKNKDYKSCYKEKGFTSYYYWSSTTYGSGTGNAWGVNFGNGRTYSYGKSHNRNVRCVRAGQ